MIHRVGIIAPIEPGLLASLCQSFDLEVKINGVHGHQLELYILESNFDRPPLRLEFILDPQCLHPQPDYTVIRVSKFPEYVKFREYKEAPNFEPVTPLGSLKMNHKKYKKRGKY